MSLDAWQDNWRQDINQAAKKLGYRAARDYAADRPESTFAQLAEELGEVMDRRFAPIQIERILRDEALSYGNVYEFAATSLVRRLRELMPNGWNVGPDPVFDYAHATAVWISGLPNAYQERGRRLVRRLREIVAIDGWLPTSPNDTFLVREFHESERE